MRVPKRDLVDWVDAAGNVLLRHPFLCLAVASEAALLLAALGWLPGPVALVVGLPAYAVHALSSLVFGPSYVPAVAGLLGSAGLLDRAWRGALRAAEPKPRHG